METAERTKEYTIKDIEALTFVEAQEMAEKTYMLKGHVICYVDFGGYFGYSALVFYNGHHIHYANDYELHHKGKTKDELEEWYWQTMNHKLFADSDFSAPLKSYDEYRAKASYLTGYYNMRTDYETVFHINPTKEEQKAFERKTKNMTYDPIGFCYVPDADFVKHHIELWNALQKRYEETSTDYEYQKSAFYYELGNHEYHINHYQGDWDTLSAFGDIEWHGQGAEAREKYFDELGFNEIQRKAFNDARKQFLEDAINNDWY